MEDIVKKLQDENDEYKRKSKKMKAFYDQHNINGHEDLIKIITEYNNNLIIESDTLKKFKEIEHNLIIDKLDMLSIKRGIFKYNKIKTKSDNKIKKIKEINKDKLSLKYAKFSQELELLEKEFYEWEKIPKCADCSCDFNNDNIPLEVQKYGFSKLCKVCIISKLEKIIESTKDINTQLSEDNKKSAFLNKLITRNYTYLTLYSELQIKSKEENFDLYDDKIVSLAGFNPKNSFDKYKLGNLCYRSNKLISTFGDKLLYFDVTESELSRMGKLEFEALCNVTSKVLGYNTYDDLMDKLNIGEPSSDFEEDNDDDYIPEPPDSDYEDEYESDHINDTCIECGTTNILPGKNICITCKFSVKPQITTRIVF